jgi:DNA primase
MSLPPAFLDELRARVPLSRVVGRKVVWDGRKSNQAKGDFWAPCPFHQEKSPSFHVDDRKGFYYCFGCHAKGDAITFLKDAENMSFIEAVETLAREAGMAMPAPDPLAQARAEARTSLADVMEAAVGHYRLMLRGSAGAEARAYLVRRGISESVIERFDIGFAPDQRLGLMTALTARGIAADLIVEAGLAARPDDGGPPYDRFRGRIIYPIRDARGRCIGLGGRAMDPAARAKYLNSPETPLFDKGRSLYNVGPAREAAGKGQTLIVAEGYMDVIALVQAGFGAAVAPLGTAVTEDQLRLIWRIHPEPIIALDGDAAGVRAGLRLADLALGLIEAGQSLRFAVLPQGQDPDDLIRQGGRAAFETVLGAARPMITLLWQRETDGQVFDSPERRAALDRRLRRLLARIADPELRAHYVAEFRRLRADLFGLADRGSGQGGARGRAQGAGQGAGQGWGQRIGRGQASRPGLRAGGGSGQGAAALPGTRASALAGPGGEARAETLREAAILATLALNPALITTFLAELEAMQPALPDHRTLHAALLAHPPSPPSPAAGRPLAAPAASDATDVAATAAAALGPEAGAVLSAILRLDSVRIAPGVRGRADPATLRAALSEDFARLRARRNIRAEIAEALQDGAALADDGVTWRVAQAARALERAERAGPADGPDQGEDRAALSATLQGMIDAEVWVRKRR